MSEQSKVQFDRAIILGGSIGGLAAAAALHEHCEEVVLIEKDDVDFLTPQPTLRRGVPQSGQLHNIVGRGQQSLEMLFPGILDSLQDAGAKTANVSEDTHVFELGHVMPERNLGLSLLSVKRPVLEYVVRQALEKLATHSNVQVLKNTQATGLIVSADHRVEGVAAKSPRSQSETILGGLIVDATGSSTRALDWLKACRHDIPQLEKRRFDQWYVSTVFKRPKTYEEQSDFWLTFATPPKSRGGLISPVDDDKWYVSVSGRANDPVPRTIEEVKAYAATLEDPTIFELIKPADAISSPHRFTRTWATWRRYDLMPQPLSGFLPIGDAFAALNPLFGQGTSIASWQAAELSALLKNQEGVDTLTSTYLARAAQACNAAWDLGKVVDNAITRSDTSNDSLSENERKIFTSLLFKDPALHRLYVRVWHLLEPVESLQTYYDHMAQQKVPYITTV